MQVGLRIDVDTLRGTKLGVPNLCDLLKEASIHASFFFCVGPDNMGRHLWRLLKPAFLWKMMRSRAASLYGWDILVRGTIWPGPIIGKRLADVIRSAADAGHETGLHCWDHHAWQAHIDRMDKSAVHDSLRKGVDLLTEITGCPPTCSAVPGWKCTDTVLQEKADFAFQYNSDCRGRSIFRPIVDGETLAQPQIPVTLPTYDEVIGRDGVTNANYNEYQLSLLDPAKLNVLTIHAEVEGIICLNMFREFVKMAASRGVSFVPLGDLLKDGRQIESAAVVKEILPGREGWIAFQAETGAGDGTS